MKPIIGAVLICPEVGCHTVRHPVDDTLSVKCSVHDEPVELVEAPPEDIVYIRSALKPNSHKTSYHEKPGCHRLGPGRGVAPRLRAMVVAAGRPPCGRCCLD